MKETEKIEIMHFSQEGYVEDGKNVYETGKKMTALADKVADEGYDAVFLMGVGGTWDELMQLEYLMNKFGARDLRRVIRKAVEDPAAERLIDGSLASGGTLVVDADENGEVVLK